MNPTEGSTGSKVDTGHVERRLIPTSFGYIHCRVAGTGPPVVMLHASVRSSAMFVSTMRALSHRVRSYALDLPGHGDSDHPDKPLTIAGYADAVREAMGGLGLAEAVVMGQAVGTKIAIELAATSPRMAEALVLLSSPFYPTEDNAKERHAIARAAYRTDRTGFPEIRHMEEVLERDMIHAPRVPTQEWLDQENVDLIKAGRDFWNAMDAGQDYSPNVVGRLERIECPTLLLWGAGFLYAKMKDEYVKRVKNHRVALIPDCGLFPQIDNPEQYLKAITDFLAELPQRPHS